MEHISWLGVGVAGLAVFIFGALWYGLIFGRVYRRELGVPDPGTEGAKGPQASFFIVQLLAAVVMALALAFLLGEDPTVAAGALAGLVAGVLVSAAQEQLFQAEGKSRTILFLHEGYFLIALTGAGAILGALQ